MMTNEAFTRATVTTTPRTCRVMVVGSSRPRLAKVMSYLIPLEQEQGNTSDSSAITVEYLPCVAQFDSYQDEESGTRVRYLLSVNYHGANGSDKVGSSLAPFFDQEPPQSEEKDNGVSATQDLSYLGILGAAIGMGLEDEQDIDKLQTFFQTLHKQLPLKVIRPNPPYQTMKEETEAFRALSPEQKDQMAAQATMGPAKMAQFAHDYAHSLMQEILDRERARREKELQKLEAEKLRQEETQRQEEQQRQQAMAEQVDKVDETKPRYACRKCRTLLFAEADLAEHVPAKHKFSARKKQGNNNTASPCQSHFLADGDVLPWMGDMSAVEGRLQCPKCQTKVGTWHWAGAQCSCGTWVSPAIQIPKSKVDTLMPSMGAGLLPPGTIISPFCPQAAATVAPGM